MAGMRSQPQGRAQINWANPITQGLVFAYVATPTGYMGYAVDGQNIGTYQNTSGTTVGTLALNPMGQAMRALTGTQPPVAAPVHPAMQTQNYSLLAVGTATLATNQSALDDDNGGTGTRKYQFRLNNGKVEFIPFISTDTVISIPAFGTALTAADVAKGVVMGATASPTRVAAFQNGKVSSTSVSGTLATPTNQPYIGIRKTAVQAWATGGLNLVCAWSRTLSDADMQSLAANPWQIFADQYEDDEFPSAAPAGSTGSLNVTLGTVSLAATGSVPVTGSSSMTLGAMTTAATGGVAASGSLAITLDALTAAGNGDVSESGALSSTLNAATLNASGTVSAAGTLTATLGPAVLSASGFVLTNGVLIGTLAPMTLAGAGFVDSGSGQNGGGGITGQLAGQLQPLTTAAAGGVTIQGQAGIFLGALSASSAGLVSDMGQAAAALGALSVSAYGGVPVAGVLQATLGELTLAATAGMFVFTRSQARTYVIQPENRRYTIAAENRTYRIEP